MEGRRRQQAGSDRIPYRSLLARSGGSHREVRIQRPESLRRGLPPDPLVGRRQRRQEVPHRDRGGRAPHALLQKAEAFRFRRFRDRRFFQEEAQGRRNPRRGHPFLSRADTTYPGTASNHLSQFPCGDGSGCPTSQGDCENGPLFHPVTHSTACPCSRKSPSPLPLRAQWS